MDFTRFERGIEVYKDVPVFQGPYCHDHGVRSYGFAGDNNRNYNGGVVFIGISPAKDEVTRSHRPLTGPSGLMLNACLEAIGQHRQYTYCTNLVCTWMDNPDEQSMLECMPRLEQELDFLKPKLIILLGSIVTERLTGRPFKKVRGAVQWSTEFNTYVMATYHPSAILHGMGDYGASKDDKASRIVADFIRDLRKIPQVLEWEPGAPEAKIRYRVVTSIEQAQNVLDNLPRSADFPITLDVETTYGKDDEQVEVFKDDVLCVGVGSENFAWVFTPSALYDIEGNPALHWPTDIWWTMHHSIFDSQVVRRKLGQWITIHEDTMLQSYSLDERSGVHRLKTLAREYLAVGFYEDDRFYGKMKLDEIPRAMLYEYNAKDVIYTTRLCHKFRKWQVADNVRDFYNRLLIPAVNMYKETQYHGVNIDTHKLLEFTIIWGLRINELETELQQMVQDEGWEGEINLQSPDQLAQFIFRTLSLPIIKYTKGGKPSVDKETLDKLEDQHPFIGKLTQIRRYYKKWAQYIETLPATLKVDGRAHPIVKLHGTETGRPSYTELAIQTFDAPSQPTEFNKMRELIIPPPFEGYMGTDNYVPPKDDEYVLIEVDVGKAELWQAYTYSQDPQILADLLSGDYHTNVAMDIYEKPREAITGDDRVWAKRTSFGIIYLIEENTLSKLTKSTPSESRIRIDRWYARNKVYKVWSDETVRTILSNGELISKTGRKRRIIILDNAVRAAKQAVNFPIQATSSDVVVDSAVQMHPKLKEIGSHILFTVHDSIVTIALRSRLQEHCQIMHDDMISQHFDGVVRMPVEVKIGDSWGTVKGVHDCSESPTHKMNVGNNPYGIKMGGHCLYPYYKKELGVTYLT